MTADNRDEKLADSAYYQSKDDILLCLHELEAEKYSTYFTFSKRMEERACSIDEVARKTGSCRLKDIKDVNLDWFDTLSDDDIFLWFVYAGTDICADLLEPITDFGAATRHLLPGVTPADVERRKAKVSAIVRARMSPK